MLQNAYFLAKIGADTAENEQQFAEMLAIGRRVAAPCGGRLTLSGADIPRGAARSPLPSTGRHGGPSGLEIRHLGAVHVRCNADVTVVSM